MLLFNYYLFFHSLPGSSALASGGAAFVRSPGFYLSGLNPPRGAPLPRPRMKGKVPRPRPLGPPRVIILSSCIIGLKGLGRPRPGRFVRLG